MVSPREMQTASAAQLRQVLAAAHVLLVDHEPVVVDIVTGVLKRYGLAAIEQAASAEEALDMLGYTTRPYDLVLLRAGLPDDGAKHVLRVLSRQAARVRITLHGSFDLVNLANTERYAGVARCIEIAGLPGIVRGVAMVLASNATLAHLFNAGVVPETMTSDWAQAIYGALPNQPSHRLKKA